jgi:predicted Fe-Mo cluster-binding NifX family protein
MKIAVISDDGKTISRHFGRAPYYLVLTVEDGKIVAREQREKIGHNHFHGGIELVTEGAAEAEHDHEHGHGAGHGMDEESHGKHAQMAETIADCEVLLCGGMGNGAYQSMQRLNIRPIITDLSDVDAAVAAFLDGSIVNRTDRLH